MDSPWFTMAIFIGLAIAVYETFYGASGIFPQLDTIGSIFRYGR